MTWVSLYDVCAQKPSGPGLGPTEAPSTSGAILPPEQQAGPLAHGALGTHHGHSIPRLEAGKSPGAASALSISLNFKAKETPPMIPKTPPGSPSWGGPRSAQAAGCPTGGFGGRAGCGHPLVASLGVTGRPEALVGAMGLWADSRQDS